LNTTKEEGNGNKLPSPSLLQQHYRRRQRHIAIVFFFYATPSQKKMTAHCCRLFLLKHKENKTHKKTTKKKPREGKELTFKLPLCPLTIGSHSYPFDSNTFSWHLFLLKQKKKKTHTQKKNPIERKKNVEKVREVTFLISLLHLG
jgi:hypothetical protein